MFRPQPMHVTRAVQKAYGIEHPIGDPFGGAAYGELNGGGSVGKIFSSALPIIAGAAMMIGSGGALAPLIIGGAMIAGGAMTGVGAITGNQTLSKIGGITSAVAGIAGLGYSAYSNWDTISNFFAEGSSLTGAAEGGAGAMEAAGATFDAGAQGGAALNNVNAPSVAADIVNTSSNMTPTVSGAFDANAFAGEMANQIAQTQAPVASNLQSALAPNNLLATTQGVTDAGGVGSSLGNVGMEFAPFGGDAATGFGTAQPFVGTPAALPGSAAPFGSTGAATVADAGSSGSFMADMMNSGNEGSGLLSSVGKFIEKNPVASMMGLQAISGMAEGASPKSQAEGEYLQAMAQLKIAETNYINSGKSAEAEAEFNRAKAYEQEKRKAYNDSIVNMQKADTSNLYQTMYPGSPNPAGLINQART